MPKKTLKKLPFILKNFYENYQQIPMVLDLGLASLGACYVQLKDFEKLDALYQKLNDNRSPYAESYVAYAKAKIDAQLGHREKAITLLKESKQLGQEFLWFKFQNDPFLESLFEEPEFEDLVLR